jgi:hypothetical protein
LGALNEELVLTNFHKCLELFFTKKKLNVQFLVEFINRQPWLAWNSVDQILEGVLKGTRVIMMRHQLSRQNRFSENSTVCFVGKSCSQSQRGIYNC